MNLIKLGDPVGLRGLDGEAGLDGLEVPGRGWVRGRSTKTASGENGGVLLVAGFRRNAVCNRR